jgi:hypothetical protein
VTSNDMSIIANSELQASGEVIVLYQDFMKTEHKARKIKYSASRCFAYPQNRIQAQNYWCFGLCPSFGILDSRKHNVSETGSVSVLR